jgi:hypothetical protein
MDKLPAFSPMPFSSRFYRLLARELFGSDTVPIVSGERVYAHLNKVREYANLDHLVILQIRPRPLSLVFLRTSHFLLFMMRRIPP